MNKFKNKWIFIIAILVIILGIVIYFNRDDISQLIGISTKETYDSISILTDGKSDETKTCNSNKPNLIWALEYNDTVSSSTDGYCVSGKEDTCKASTCYMDKSVGSCPAGTIILYRVNDDKIYYFNVLHDDGATITMQMNTYIILDDGTNTFSQNASGNNSEGPITALDTIEEFTKDWTNVNQLNYCLGKGCTPFLKYPNNSVYKSDYTGYDPTDDKNTGTWTYSYGESTPIVRNGYARVISIQEALDDGCWSTRNASECPSWFYDNNHGYWTLNTSWVVSYTSGFNAFNSTWTYNQNHGMINYSIGLRPVIEINK
jgi:hypothetical protein